jgi:hypothetical protein
MENIYTFKVTGGFDIKPELKPELSFDHRTVGFKLPNGSSVRPIVALEVENKDGSYTYITSESKMADLGFEGLDYGNVEFLPTECV